jgi:O-antigen/teichoic acid export membrane protein
LLWSKNVVKYESPPLRKPPLFVETVAFKASDRATCIDVRQPPAANQRAAHGTLFLAVGRACSYFLAYIATTILARILGPADYGFYGIIMSVLVWVEQIGRHSFSLAAAKMIPEQENDSVAIEQTAFFLNLILFFMLFGALLVTAPFLAELLQVPEGAGLFRIAALDLPIFGAYVLCLGVLQGRRDFAGMGIAESLYAAAKLVGVVLLVGLWLSVPGALIINIVASAAGLLFVICRVSIKITLPRNGLSAPLSYLALPIALFTAVHQITGVLDLWFLKIFDSAADARTVGFYVAARNMAKVPSFVLVSVSHVLLPSLSRALATKDVHLSQHYVQQAVRFLWLFILPVTLLIALTAESLTTLLFSEIYLEGARYLRILVISAAALAFGALFVSALNARGEAWLSGAVASLLLPVALLLNVFIIPRYGAFGAAWSSTITALLGALVFGVLVYKRFGSLFRLQTLLRTVIAALVMVALASQLTVTGPLLLLYYAGYMGVYALVLLFTGELTREDLRSLTADANPLRSSPSVRQTKR